MTGYRRQLLRFEIKKVADVQRYNGELRSVLHEVKHGAVVEEAPPPVAQQAAPRRSMGAIPAVAAANLRNVGGHRMITRNMRTAFHAGS